MLEKLGIILPATLILLGSTTSASPISQRDVDWREFSRTDQLQYYTIAPTKITVPAKARVDSVALGKGGVWFGAATNKHSTRGFVGLYDPTKQTVSEYQIAVGAVKSAPAAFVANGPGNAIWFVTGQTVHRSKEFELGIGYVTPNGGFSVYPDTPSWGGFTLGSDGAMWSGYATTLERATEQGVEQFTLPPPIGYQSSEISRTLPEGDDEINPIVNGPSGYLWYCALVGGGKREFGIEAVTVQDELAAFFPLARYGCRSIMYGPDGNLWIVEESLGPEDQDLDQVTPQGDITKITHGIQVVAERADPVDKSIWYSSYRETSSGTSTELTELFPSTGKRKVFDLGNDAPVPEEFVVDHARKAVWFTSDYIGEFFGVSMKGSFR